MRVVCKTNPGDLNAFYEFLLPYLQGNFMGQRVTTATAFAEMVSHCNQDKELLQNLVNNLLTIMVDDNLKLMALRGLGNIAAAGKDEVNRFASTVIDALMCSIDSPDESMAMEAMSGLARSASIQSNPIQSNPIQSSSQSICKAQRYGTTQPLLILLAVLG
jgi:hypothetical protein